MAVCTLLGARDGKGAWHTVSPGYVLTKANQKYKEIRNHRLPVRSTPQVSPTFVKKNLSV